MGKNRHGIGIACKRQNGFMISAIFSQPNYVGAKKMLDATVLRQQAVASNLANIETPGYKRIDIAPTFASELKRAIAGGDTTQISSVQPSLMLDPKAKAVRPDGNTVMLEDELIKMNENTLQHSVQTQLLTSSLLKLRLAITGRSA